MGIYMKKYTIRGIQCKGIHGSIVRGIKEGVYGKVQTARGIQCDVYNKCYVIGEFTTEGK